MNAIVLNEFGGPEKLRLADFPMPTVGPDQALVRVRACGVNRLDIWVRMGRRAGVGLPHIPGSEVAGEVVSLGREVVDLKPGDAVAVMPWLHCGRCESCRTGEVTTCASGDILGVLSQGGYAEYVTAPIVNLVRLPGGVSFEDAAAVTLSAITAWHMVVRRAAVRPGENVLVLGAGSGVGSAAIQIAKLCGARVLTTASSDEKLRRARDLGADETINHGKLDIAQEVSRLTGGRGVDVVVEHVGAATWDQSVASLATNGRLVTCGVTTGPEGKIDIRRLYSRQISILGSMGGNSHDLEAVLTAAARGTLRAVVDRALPLADAAEAQSSMERREQFGKILLVP